MPKDIIAKVERILEKVWGNVPTCGYVTCVEAHVLIPGGEVTFTTRY